MKAGHGFTLIELLITVALISIFAVTQFALMIEGVRRHDLVSKQAAIQGEARNVLSALGRDIRAASGFPAELGERKAGPDTLLVVIESGTGASRSVAYTLSPGETVRAGREGRDVYLRKSILIREEWVPGEGAATRTSQRVINRDVEFFRWNILSGGSRPVISCSIGTAEVSNGRRVHAINGSLFTPRGGAFAEGAQR